MSDFIDHLRQSGIHPYGSEESLLYEKRITRFLSREYQRLIEKPSSLDNLGISTRSGPMWEETNELIEEHYDENLEFFETFLDTSYSAYSMALYGDTPEQVKNSSITLEQAQTAKFDTICQRMGINGNERILNIGCGFGSLEKYLFNKFPDLEIVSITPSSVQVKYLSDQMQNTESPLFQKQFSLIQNDFDALSNEKIGKERYDIVCSIGLLEQVKNMQALFAKIADCLKPGGRTFHHYIVSQIVIPQFLNAKETLIGAYFPGGRIWPIAEMEQHTDYFTLENSWFINGMNYWKTLDEWHNRFWKNIEDLHQIMPLERVRHWNDYFILCKACFSPFDGKLFGNGHYLFRKK